MESDNLDAVLQQVREISRLFGTVYKDVTGEDLDVESALRHSPLLVLGLAAGAGVAAGWWLGRRGAPALPPPPPPRRGLAAEGLERGVEYLNERLPDAVDRMRESLPEVILSDAVKARAQNWMSAFAERQVRENVDTLADAVDGTLSRFFRTALERLEGGPDVRLPEPEDESDPDDGPR